MMKAADMKKHRMLTSAAVMVMVIVLGGVAGAASLTPAVTATGTVSDTCSSAVGGNITFNIDPSLAGPITPATTDAGNAAPTVKCTKSQSHAVTCTSAHAYNLTIGNDGSTDPIAYTITGCPANITGQGFGTATAINFGLSLSAVDYQNALTGAHADTITVTVTY
jgi:spore coat protein U-like protein